MTLMSYLGSILDEMKEFGGAEECVQFVLKHDDGRLDGQYALQLQRNGIFEAVRHTLRSRRLKENRHVPGHPSIDVPTGEVDEEGTPIVVKKFASMKQLLLSKDWVSYDKVVDSQVKRIVGGMIIANATVTVAWSRGYQRELPFPEQAEGEDVV